MTCHNCGNTSHWRNASIQASGNTATCGKCGTKVTSDKGIIAETISGGMHFNIRR